MKTIGRVGLVVFAALLAIPLAAQAGHRHHGGGYGSGYGGGCGCGAAPVYHAPPAHAQYGEPTPAVAQANSGTYRSFSFSPTPDGEAAMAAPAAAPMVVNQGYYQAAPMYAPGYNYSGYGYQRSRSHRSYENAINRSLGNNDYGRGR